MAKLKIRPLGPDVCLVVAEGCGTIVSRKFYHIAPEELEQLLSPYHKLVKRFGPRQVTEVIIPLALGQRVPARAEGWQKALDRAAAAMGARLIPGPRGTKWQGYYEIPA